MEMSSRVEFNFLNSDEELSIVGCTVPCLCGSPVRVGDLLGEKIHRCGECNARWHYIALESEDEGSDTLIAKIVTNNWQHKHGVVTDNQEKRNLENMKPDNGDPFGQEDDDA